MDRFSERPFVSKYDPDSTNPLHIGNTYGCDICEERQGIFEAPEKCKIKFCRKCKPEVMENYELTEDDVEYV